jgi:hypothetical protein
LSDESTQAKKCGADSSSLASEGGHSLFVLLHFACCLMFTARSASPDPYGLRRRSVASRGSTYPPDYPASSAGGRGGTSGVSSISRRGSLAADSSSDLQDGTNSFYDVPQRSASAAVSDKLARRSDEAEPTVVLQPGAYRRESFAVRRKGPHNQCSSPADPSDSSRGRPARSHRRRRQDRLRGRGRGRSLVGSVDLYIMKSRSNLLVLQTNPP